LAELVRASSCVSVDVRKATDIDAEGSQLGVHEAVPISFTQMVLSPADVLGQVASLKKSGRRLVLYSEVGDRMDACGLLGALLLDVFGFDEQLVCRLQGGCTAWAQWLEANKDDARTLEPLAMRLSRLRKKRERDLAHIRAELQNRSTTSAAVGSPSASPEPRAATEAAEARQEETQAPAAPGQSPPSLSPQEEDCEMPPSQADNSQCSQHSSDAEPNDEDEALPESPVLKGNLDFHNLPPSSDSEAEAEGEQMDAGCEKHEEAESINFAKQPQDFVAGCCSQSVARPGQEYAVLGGS